MTGQLGSHDVELWLDPQPELLKQITGIEPERRGLHVLLEPFGIHSAQRLALSAFEGGFVVGLWPAEQKTQAVYLYGQRLAQPMIERARERGWKVEPNPHLAFRNSSAPQRLYMRPTLDALEYAARWEGGDLSWVGQYERDDLRSRLWPWLKDRGYAEPQDDAALEEFISAQLGNRPAFLRPGLRFEGGWSRATVSAAGSPDSLAPAVSADVDAILAAAAEPSLPTGSRDSPRVDDAAPRERSTDRDFGVASERKAAPGYLRELDLLRLGPPTAVREYLEKHLHSRRFFVDDGKIWLELPNHSEQPPDRVLLVWYRQPESVRIAYPAAASRPLEHAVPHGWDATLCRIPLQTWTTGVRFESARDVTCRWCWVRLLAAEVVAERPVPRR